MITCLQRPALYSCNKLYFLSRNDSYLLFLLPSIFIPDFPVSLLIPFLLSRPTHIPFFASFLLTSLLLSSLLLSFYFHCPTYSSLRSSPSSFRYLVRPLGLRRLFMAFRAKTNPENHCLQSLRNRFPIFFLPIPPPMHHSSLLPRHRSTQFPSPSLTHIIPTYPMR